jgi:hypothetical protein
MSSRWEGGLLLLGGGMEGWGGLLPPGGGDQGGQIDKDHHDVEQAE